MMKIEEILKTSRFIDEKHKASLNLLYTSYWFKTHVSTALKEFGFTSEQYNVMRILKGKHPEQMCVKDIAQRTIEKNSNVPRIVQRLLAKHFVERTISAEDKRETLVSLTEKGMQQLEKANSAVSRLNEMIGLNEEEAKQLNELLEKMRK